MRARACAPRASGVWQRQKISRHRGARQSHTAWGHSGSGLYSPKGCPGTDFWRNRLTPSSAAKGLSRECDFEMSPTLTWGDTRL